MPGKTVQAFVPAATSATLRVVPALAMLVVLFAATALQAESEIKAAPLREPASSSRLPVTGPSQIIPGIATPSLGLAMLPPAVVPATRPAETTATTEKLAEAPAAASTKNNDGWISRKSATPATQATANNGQALPMPSFDVGRVVLSLAAVIALILFLKWGGKKVFALPSSGASSVMQVVSRTPLAPRQQLLLVRVGRRLMVIGDSAGRLSGLGEIADPDEVASLLGQSQAMPSAAGPAVSFKSMFRRMGASRSASGETGWEELQRDPVEGLIRERSGLLGSNPVLDEPIDDALEQTPRRVTSSEAVDQAQTEDELEARQAVEAARYDIQALRAKLREVTGRLTTDAMADGCPAAEPGDGKASDAA